MKKEYSSAPLPFMGQKRMFVAKFKEILRQYPDDAVFVDLFGGSGLLSHVAKREKPGSRVIYNDFDNYRQRLANIGRTNILLADLRRLAKDCPRHKLITGKAREAILTRVSEEAETGFVDYVTLSTSLLFSMKYTTSLDGLQKESFYNTIRKTGYSCEGYLDGLEIASCDYKVLFERYKDEAGVVFIVDPPYLCTQTDTYRMNWGLSDYLDVLSVLRGTEFIYFTSDKSSILELCQWMGEHPAIGNPFQDTVKLEFNAHMNYNSSYTDMMLYKKRIDIYKSTDYK